MDSVRPIHFTDAETEAARHLLWMESNHLSGPPAAGQPPGSFHESLIDAMHKADPMNRAKLVSVFPQYDLPMKILQMFGSEALAKQIGFSS